MALTPANVANGCDGRHRAESTDRETLCSMHSLHALDALWAKDILQRPAILLSALPHPERRSPKASKAAKERALSLSTSEGCFRQIKSELRPGGVLICFT